MDKITSIIFAICLMTGALITWPFRHRLYDHYHGNEGAGIACAFYGLLFWIAVLLVVVIRWLVK